MGSRVRELRKKYHLSQQMLADKLGTSQQTISRIENDIYRTPVDLLMRLSNQFNVTVDYLLELTGTDNGIDSGKISQYYDFILEYDELDEAGRHAVRQLTRSLIEMGSTRQNNER